MTTVSVVLIREKDEELFSSSCCPRLGGDFRMFRTQDGLEHAFPERRKVMKEMGAVYMRLKEAFGDRARVQYIDPRNYIVLMHRLLTDVLTYKPPLLTAFKLLTLSFPFPAVIVNGRLLMAREIGDPEEIVEKVRAFVGRGDG